MQGWLPLSFAHMRQSSLQLASHLASSGVGAMAQYALPEAGGALDEVIMDLTHLWATPSPTGGAA
jgi:hypothetical protein